MSEPYLGQIEAFAFGSAPRGWALCAGQVLPINQNQALFSVLGTMYGGNGTTNFQLPDLRSRVAIGVSGANPGGQGQMIGEETHTLIVAEVPPHTHQIVAINNGLNNGTNTPDATVYPASASQSGTAVTMYSTAAPTIAMAPLSQSGGSQPHANMAPYTTLNYCIALNGIYPSRN